MLYGIIRYVLGAVIFIIAFFLIKKSNILKKNLLYAVSFIVISVLVTLLYFVPVENLFMNFSSPEKAFNYISSCEIQHIVYGSETDLVIAGKGATDTYKILPKTDKGWKLSNGLETEKYALFHKGISIEVFRHKKTDDYYVRLFNIDGGEIEVSDSCGSDFSKTIKTADESSKQIYYYAFVNNFNDEYTLNLNGEEVKVSDFYVVK